MGDPVDTFPLRDQRHMIGPTPAGTIEGVEANRAAWVARNGYALRRRDGDLSVNEVQSRQRIPAFVSAGKWIAMCPKCNDGVAAWPFVERGVCLGCGTAYRIDYPSREEILVAIQALSARPAELQNWMVHYGETAEQLMEENQRVGMRPDLPRLGAARTVTVGGVEEVLGREAVDRLREAGLL